MKRIAWHVPSFSGLVAGIRRPHPADAARLLRSVLLLVLGFGAAYILIALQIAEDRAGFRTLGVFSLLITAFRLVGRGMERLGAAVVAGWGLVIAAVALLVLFGITLFFRRRYRASSWRHDVGLSLLAPSLLMSAVFLLRGNGWVAAAFGLLAAIPFLDMQRLEAASLSGGRFLWLIPVGIAFILRFYALVEVPNGYAEHAAVQHADFTIPYAEALLASLRSLSFQPFLPMAWNALLVEHSGPFALVDSIGFAIFGVSPLVSRLVSAALGTLTIYVAYRLGSELHSTSLGFIFSTLLAVSAWHITISRYATAEHVLSPLQLLLSLLYVFRALKGGRIFDIVMAALLTALAWVIYAPNLVVPLIAGLIMLYQVIREPRQALKNWVPAVLGVLCFGLVSYALLSRSFPQGLFQPNIRTGYLGSGPLLSDWPKRIDMVGKEAAQLFTHASDPWFDLPAGGGLSILESILLIPGIFLAVRFLADRQHTNLGLLILAGLPVAFLPAVFAPDESFRRLIIVATIASLASALAAIYIIDLVRSAGLPRAALVACGVVSIFLLSAGGAFTYFDRVTTFEEIKNASFRTLAQTTSVNMTEQEAIVVVARRDEITDVNRYMQLMAYDHLKAAQAQGVPMGNLYTVTSCEDAVGPGRHKETLAAPPVIVVTTDVSQGLDPCTPAYLSKLLQYYRGSTLVVAKPGPLPADLAPAPR